MTFKGKVEPKMKIQ